MPEIKDFQWNKTNTLLPALIQTTYDSNYYRSEPVLLLTISGRCLIAVFTCLDESTPEESKLLYKWYVNESDIEIPKVKYWCYIGKPKE